VNAPARILLVTTDTLGPRMAGPAIRATALAHGLAQAGHPVELVTTTPPCELHADEVTISAITGYKRLRAAVDRSDVVIFQGWAFAPHPWIWECGKVIVADIYDPLHLEAIEQTRSQGDDYWWAATANARGVLREQLRSADFFLCASERQRGFWLGHLAAEGRINPATYDADPTLRNLIDIVPFGIDDKPPERTGPGLREAHPELGPEHKIVLWGGGVYEWFDPLTLVRALDLLRRQVPEVRLMFMGVKHPSPAVPDMPIVAQTRALIRELDLDDHVVMNERWVPYEERQNVLLDGDVMVTTHKDHVETELSFRTRVLDYLWVARPIVTTGGDVFGDLIEREQLGVVVPPDDVEALAEALHRVLTDEEFAAGCRRRIEALRPSLTWSEVIDPLRRFCADPHRAADLVDPDRWFHVVQGDGIRPRGMAGLRYDMRLTRKLLAEGGARNVASRAWGRVLRLLGRLPTPADVDDAETHA
jgi:glycosyltransferase involved in cell wall biosynthesis